MHFALFGGMALRAEQQIPPDTEQSRAGVIGNRNDTTHKGGTGVKADSKAACRGSMKSGRIKAA